MATEGTWKVETWDYPHATPPRQDLQIVSPSLLLATVQCDFVGDNTYVVPRADAEDNARLFAAAKDLLSAVTELLGDLDEFVCVECGQGRVSSATFARARQALAKAKGEQS